MLTTCSHRRGRNGPRALREEAMMIHRAGGARLAPRAQRKFDQYMAFTHDQRKSSHRGSKNNDPQELLDVGAACGKGGGVASRKTVVPSGSSLPLSPSIGSSSEALRFERGASDLSSILPATRAHFTGAGPSDYVPGGSIDHKSRAAPIRWYGSSFRAAYNSQIFEVTTALLVLRFVFLLIQNRTRRKTTSTTS